MKHWQDACEAKVMQLSRISCAMICLSNAMDLDCVRGFASMLRLEITPGTGVDLQMLAVMR